MDQVGALMTRANFEPLKEPKGFIKFLEFILAIFAFATTTSYSSRLTFDVFCCPLGETCPGKTQTIKWSYPFELNKNTLTTSFCNSTGEKTSPYGDFSSSAEFYVFIGVMAFLYSIGALVLYIFFDDMYRDNRRLPQIDFIISAVLTFMWLVASSAWADGVNDLKYYSGSSELFLRHVPECLRTAVDSHCKVTEKGNYASLNVSIIFGFLNMGVWAGNLWFLFKETPWHKDQQSPSPNPMPSPSSADKGGQSPYGGSDVYNSSNPYGPAPPTNPYGSQGANQYGGPPPPQAGNPYGPPSQVAPSYMSQPPQGRI